MASSPEPESSQPRSRPAVPSIVTQFEDHASPAPASTPPQGDAASDTYTASLVALVPPIELLAATSPKTTPLKAKKHQVLPLPWTRCTPTQRPVHGSAPIISPPTTSDLWPTRTIVTRWMTSTATTATVVPASPASPAGGRGAGTGTGAGADTSSPNQGQGQDQGHTRGSGGRASGGSGGSVRESCPLEPRPSVAVLTNERDPRLRLSLLRVRLRRVLTTLFPVVDPRSSGNLTWDSLIMVVVLLSAIMVPIEVGFASLALPSAWRVCAIAIDVLFGLDMVHNFFVGFYPNDEDTLVTDRRVIARNYASGWFLPDLLAVFPTDLVLSRTGMLTGTSTDKSVLSLKLTRMVRLVRVTKLARLIKLRQFAMKVEEVLELDAVITRLTQLLSEVLLVTHLLACFWHLLGDVNEGDGSTSSSSSSGGNSEALTLTWLTRAGLQHESASVQYLYSVYWVVVTLAGVGYGDIVGTTTNERVFAMCTQVIGASGFGLLIGNITKILANWNREVNSRARQLGMIQQFVKNKAIPKALQADLLRYFRHYIANTSAFDERQLLGEFSLSLRSEVLSETYRSTFFLIPALQRLSAQFVMDMALAIKPLLAVKGDVLARERSVGTEMFILIHGLVEVTRTVPENAWIIVLEILTAHGIFGESSLLNYTLHHNSYTAKDDCEMYTLPKEDFDRLLDEFHDVEESLTQYHQERSALYDRVFEQTLARYRVFMNSRENDPVSELVGIENIYPTLTVLLDGVLQSYRALPLNLLEKVTLEISMGVSVFNSVHEKKKIAAMLAHDEPKGWRARVKRALATPIAPDHVGKERWNAFMAVVLLVYALVIPFEVAFLQDSAQDSAQDQALALGMTVFECVCDLLFGVDILITFRTAFVDRGTGHLVLDARAIARRYLRTWFALDFAATLPLSLMLSAGDARTFQLVRVLRLLRLSRIVKLVRTFLVSDATTTTHRMAEQLLRLTFKVTFIAHLLACGYYYTAVDSLHHYGTSMLQALPAGYALWDTYIFSLHWAVTTMTTVGYGDARPTNVQEVAFVTAGVVAGASTFTYVVGTLSTIVDEVQSTSKTNRARMDRLKAYLKERKVSRPLALRLRRYYEYYLSQRDDENEDQILSSLSDNLRSQVVLHLNRDVVRKIAFFASQDDMCVSYLMGILDPEFCTPGEYVFKEGQVGRHMYFLVKGVAEILFHAETAQEVVVATLQEGNYFGEIAMLTMSKRAASIRAKTFVSLFVLSRGGLDRISQHYPDMATNILAEFKKKITHIKQTSLRHLGPLVKEDMRLARLSPRGLLGPSRSMGELAETLQGLEGIVDKIVAIYGGGDKGKRKALSCVVEHLRKYEFSLDDFLHAAESLGAASSSYASERRPTFTKVAHQAVVMKRLQRQGSRRTSF